MNVHNVLLHVTMHHLFDFLTTARIYFKFCVDVSSVKFQKIEVVPLFFYEIMDNFGQFLKNILQNHRPEIIHIWFGEFPGDLVSSMFKLGHCDLYLRFLCTNTIFMKHISNVGL